MDFFFKPKGIALIGATPNPGKVGYAILKNLLTGFKGRIYPVNPRYKEIEGLTCYPSVQGLPDPVDLAIVFVPGKNVLQIVSCPDGSIHPAVIGLMKGGGICP